MDFDNIRARGAAALAEAVDLGTQESLTLDFKSQSQEDGGAVFTPEGKLTRGGRQVLAKALSAFSNSAGGMIVFGVKCKAVDGFDCAQKLEPFPNWQRALSEVNSAVGDLLQPKNDGVDVAAFPDAKNSHLGFVVVNVPRSERRPHRSEASDQKQYFKRSGSSSHAMEHYDIEDAFKRTSSPIFELETNVWVGTNSPVRRTCQIDFWLRNVGHASAFNTSMSWTTRGNVAVLNGRQPDNVQRIRDGTKSISIAAPDLVINPQERRLIERIAIEFQIVGGTVWTIGNAPRDSAELIVDVTVYAKDSRPQLFAEEFDIARFESFPDAI